MGEGFIVRRGGVAVDLTAAPSLTLVSKTSTEIVFTITNNDALTADIFWEADDTTPDANTLSLATATTSSNQTISGLTANTEVVISAFANAAGKAGSQTVTLTVTTDPIVYTAATGGTTEEYDSGGARFKSHTFTSSGTFTVTTVGDAIDDRNKVDYLIIAGGGGGGNSGSATGGGGGAGGYRTTNGTSGANSSAESKVVVTAQGYTITIGAGGSEDTNGSNSSGLGITSTGGGAGGDARSSSGEAGNSGGSGGGGGSFGGTNGTGGTGTSAQGTNGAAGYGVNFVKSSGGSGGGAGTAGATKFGGNGLDNVLRTGSAETRGGGGGGGADTVGDKGIGGTGGGGDGTFRDGDTGTAGTVNTGGGGGGGAQKTGALTGLAGGSGIVVIRYEIAPSV